MEQIKRLVASGVYLNRSGVFNVVVEAARRASLHDSATKRLKDHFGPHCCRHWFCTHLFRAGMRREYIKVLRGDSRKEAFDLYNHIDLKELKEAYLACIPQLGRGCILLKIITRIECTGFVLAVDINCVRC
jgi:integrase/recombinase XerD